MATYSWGQPLVDATKLALNTAQSQQATQIPEGTTFNPIQPGITPSVHDPMTGQLNPIGPQPQSTDTSIPATPSPTGTYTGTNPSGLPTINGTTAPVRQTISQSYESIKNLLPQFESIPGLGDDYYKNLQDQATKRLNEQYFGGDNSLSAQLTNQMSKRGLIGSGIEAGNLVDLYKDYGSKAQDFASQLAAQRAQNDYEAMQRNREVKNKLGELGLRTAADESKFATEFATKIYESAAKNRQTEFNQNAENIKVLQNLLANTTGIDAQHRNYYRDLLGYYLQQQEQFQAPGGEPMSFSAWEQAQQADNAKNVQQSQPPSTWAEKGTIVTQPDGSRWEAQGALGGWIRIN